MALSRTPSNARMRWATWLLLFVAGAAIVKIIFLSNIYSALDSSFLSSLTNFQNKGSIPRKVIGSSTPVLNFGDHDHPESVSGSNNDKTTPFDDICQDWLEKEDQISYSRNFSKDPVWVVGEEQDWSTCSVGCVFTGSLSSERKPDAGFGLHGDSETASILRSMESSHYYPENNLDIARGKGFSVIMTTSLSSDVPVGYFSWAEYDIMAPIKPKTEKALAAAFISNCGAHNFRLQALEDLQKNGVPIDSYGACHRNRDGRVDKVEALKHYKFSLAFENSNEEDYVTEKFFQSLVAGTVPVVVGAPNIQEFAPSSNSIIHIKEAKDISSTAQTMKYLASNITAYNDMLRWKKQGPSDSFKALVDMAAVHSSCRLCIHLATQLQEKEEKEKTKAQHRPCKCKKGSETMHHLFVRERGRFELHSVFIRSHDLTIKGLKLAVLEKFKAVKHIPIWKTERPKVIQGSNQLKIYKVYPVGLTQRQALYTWKFQSDNSVKMFVKNNPCAKMEVIFV